MDIKKLSTDDWEQMLKYLAAGSEALDSKKAEIKSRVHMILGLLALSGWDKSQQLPTEKYFRRCKWQISQHTARVYPVVATCWLQSDDGNALLAAYQSDTGVDCILPRYVARVHAALPDLLATAVTFSPTLLKRFNPFFEAAGAIHLVDDDFGF